jgi:trehalose utilization protein
VAAIYPNGIHGAISAGLENEGFAIRCGSLDDPNEGLGEQLLDDTDVFLWWGHIVHEEVSDALVNRIQQRVLKGMGLIVLHSGHHSKLFRRLMGTNCNLSWRELPDGDLERVWVIHPSHPIAEDLPPYFEVPQATGIARYRFIARRSDIEGCVESVAQEICVLRVRYYGY